MIEALLIPAASILNRVRGGGIIPFPEWLPRKLASGIILSTLVAVIVKVIWVAPIILIGWYARNIIGTGYLFNAIHGWEAPKWRAVLYGTARGLLTLVTTAGLGIVYHNWIIACLGFLGALQGGIYYLAGKFKVKNTVAVAELMDGALFGIILAICLMAGN